MFILQQEVDVATLPFGRLEEVDKYLYPLYPILIESHTLLQPWPDEESRLLTPFRPFNGKV